MMPDAKKVSMSRGGSGMPSATGRVETAGRSAVKTAGPYGGRTDCPAGKGLGGGGDGDSLFKRNSRKYKHVPSTISEFMKKGISEPRRFRSLPVVQEVPMPFRKNRKYSHVNSTIGEFMKSGIREPRKFRSLPVFEEQVRVPSTNKNRKYSHVTSTIREFMKTGIREPRQLKLQLSQEILPKPFRSNSKKYSHIKSRVAVYIKYSMKEYFLAGQKPVTPIAKQPSRKNRELPAAIKIPGPLYVEEERDVNIIANLERQLRNVNKAQPTEMPLLTPELRAKFPNYAELLESDDPFEKVFALGLGYHYKFLMDYGEQGLKF